jgi:hypothetical protein
MSSADQAPLDALAWSVLSYARDEGRPLPIREVPVYAEVRRELIRAGRIRRDTVPPWPGDAP